MATQTRRAPKAPPATRRRVYPGGRPMGAPRTSTGREVTPRQVAGAPGKAAVAVTQREGRYSAKHMLTAELIAGVLIVAVRAVADYEPQADGTLKGKVGHPKGQYGPLPILAGLIVVFFILSFFASSGGLKAKLAVIAGGVVDLGLLMNSSSQFVKVTDTFGTFGKAKVPPGAWVTTGAESGLPISGAPSGSTTPALPKPRSKNPADIPPPGSIPVPPGGCPAGYIQESSLDGKATWCAPIAAN